MLPGRPVLYTARTIFERRGELSAVRSKRDKNDEQQSVWQMIMAEFLLPNSLSTALLVL